MNRLTEKQLLIVTIGITLLLTGGLGFLIWSDLKSIEDEELKTTNLKGQIAAADAEILKREEREYRVIANREISDREVAFMPEAAEIENFWDVLERFSVESGVEISEIVPNAARSGGRKKKGKVSTIQSVPQILSLRATTAEFLAFINLLENYERIINVVEFSLSGGKAPDPDGKVRHNIKLMLTTFTYSKKIASTIVSINNYEKKKEHAKVKQWLSRIKIQAKETYTLRTSIGRRDPFVSVRRLPVTTQGPEVSNAEQRARQEQMLEQLVSLVEALADGLDYQEELQKRGDLWRLQAQIKENKEIVSDLNSLLSKAQKEITIPELAERLRKEVVDPFERLKKRMGEIIDNNPKMTLDQVTEVRTRVANLFDQRGWGKLGDEVGDFLDASKNGKHVSDEARELVIEILDFRRKAKVIQGFDKRKIEISTIIYSKTGNSIAVINNKTYSEGDALDTNGQIIVVEIGEDHVIFETEGVEIKKLR